MKVSHDTCPVCLILHTTKYPELYGVLQYFIANTDEDFECIAEQILAEYINEVP